MDTKMILINRSLARALKLPSLPVLHRLMPLTGMEFKINGKRQTLYLKDLKPVTLRQIRNEIAQKQAVKSTTKVSTSVNSNILKRLSALEATVAELVLKMQTSRN